MWLIGGGHILSSEEGTGFGMPDLPWPLDTILGFCAALMLGTIVMKTVITTGEVSLLIYLREKSLLPRRGIQQLSLTAGLCAVVGYLYFLSNLYCLHPVVEDC